jgi:aspartyl-tRNA synthetase
MLDAPGFLDQKQLDELQLKVELRSTSATADGE